eukprot:1105843-Pelagomonas_calceolata.AAC.1
MHQCTNALMLAPMHRCSHQRANTPKLTPMLYALMLASTHRCTNAPLSRSVRAFSEQWEKEGRELHILVNNAGIYAMGGEPWKMQAVIEWTLNGRCEPG